MPKPETKGSVAATGYMEQLGPIIYRVAAFARSEDGTVQPFVAEVSAPEDSGKGDSVCAVSCPYLRAKPFSIYGVDHSQAVELSRWFIERSLADMSVGLVDSEGEPTALPPLPTSWS